MPLEQKNNPLHGVKLEALLQELVENYSWEILAEEINLNCFKVNPSIKSSLKFLRKTEWAREKVERFYLYDYKKLPKPCKSQFDITPRQREVGETSKVKNKENLPTENNQPNKGKFNPWDNSSKSQE